VTHNRRRNNLQIGPGDNGRLMTLDDFDEASGEDGYLYELHRGVVEVTKLPHSRNHLRQLLSARDQIIAYQFTHPGAITAVTEASDSKVLIEQEQSERHPDISVYLTPMPDVDEIWSIWVPAIAIEIVSESSIKRDYEIKPAEYLAFGVSEYWIIDGLRKVMTAKTRFRGQWKDQIIKPAQKYATRHLPGFTLDLKSVFAAAK
jgi:Uma2 family endonuclease